MSGQLRDGWQYFRLDIWDPLSRFERGEASAPADLYSDLVLAASDYLQPPLSIGELEEARNDPALAATRFLALRGTDFESEYSIVQFLERVNSVIAQYDVSGFTAAYADLVSSSLAKYNLRYRLEEPFSIRFLLPGSFANLYEELRRINTTNGHLRGLLGDFEKAFDRYARTRDDADLKTCIAKASNYAEGLASDTLGVPTTRNTLGALANQLADWPHAKVRTALIDLYGFCSDYPGIRHAGNPGNVIRDLQCRDVTLASLLLLSFSGYLSPLVRELTVLGI